MLSCQISCRAGAIGVTSVPGAKKPCMDSTDIDHISSEEQLLFAPLGGGKYGVTVQVAHRQRALTL